MSCFEKQGRGKRVQERKKQKDVNACVSAWVRSRKGICDWSSVPDCSTNLVWVISAFMLFHNTPARALHHKATRSTHPPTDSLHLLITVTHAVLNTQFTSETNSTNCLKKMTHTSTKKKNQDICCHRAWISRESNKSNTSDAAGAFMWHVPACPAQKYKAETGTRLLWIIKKSVWRGHWV